MLGSKLAVMALGLFTAGMVNRSLGPQGRGVYAEMQTWIALFAVIFGLSLESAIYHYANRTRYGDDDNSKFVTALCLSLGVSLLGALGLGLFVALFPGQTSPDTVKYLLFLVILLIVTMWGSNLSVFAQAQGAIRFASVAGFVQSICTLLIILYGYSTDSITVLYVVICAIAGQSVYFAAFFGNFLRNGTIKGSFVRSIARGMVKAGGKQHIATIATFVYTRINVRG